MTYARTPFERSVEEASVQRGESALMQKVHVHNCRLCIPCVARRAEQYAIDCHAMATAAAMLEAACNERAFSFLTV